MHKLFSRCPHGPPLLLPSSSPPKPTFPLGFFMPSSAASLFHLQPYTPFKPAPSSRVGPIFTRGCRVCRCSHGDGATTTTQRRPWAGFKETPSGSRLAWFCTAAGDGAVSPVERLDDDEEGHEGGTVKLQRRVRSVASGVTRNPDLLTIPGVGPRNLRKLVEKGIGGVDELKQLYRNKFFGESNQKMVEYLQSSVGIIHKHHAESITTYIKKTVDEESGESGSNSILKPQKKRITLCVEGNISVGKTTFLKRIANETLELRDLVEIVPEPIDKWQDIGRDHFNILDAFYAEPERYAYTFQNYVFVTRVMQERDSSAGIQPLRLMERSVFSDRMVFVRAVHEAKWMNEMEISIYESWFEPVVSCLPGLIPDGFIYLRASPDTCHKRMMIRKRDEEGGVSLDYLRGLHEKHESWLLPSQTGKHEVLSVSKLPIHADRALHPDIRDRVFFLEGPQMHSSLQKIPALILDCERDIDFNRDIDAKRHYARQVAEFFEFVKREKEVEESGKVVLSQNGGGLCFPNGTPISESALRSMNFSKTLSFLSG